MDPRQQIADQEDALQAMMDGRLAGLWTVMPAIVVSSNGNLATVRATIPRTVTLEAGGTQDQAISVLSDCPIQWPQGGGCVLTFPLAPGDEVLVVFAARDIGGWWQTGAVAKGTTSRMHDLSDAFVIPGIRSRPRAISGVSGLGAQLRSEDGATSVTLNPTAQTVTAVAPGGAAIFGNLTVTGTIIAQGDVIGAGISLNTHTHSGVQGGSGSSGPPI